jgi:hypothetical protein
VQISGHRRREPSGFVDRRSHYAIYAATTLTLTECEAAFKGIPGARTLHHGNYAGDDDHGDVDVIMHIGGPFAAYKKIAEMATARTGQAVPIVQPIRRACTALMEANARTALLRKRNPP